MNNEIEQLIDERFHLGLMPIPLIWDPENKVANSHCLAHSEMNTETYTVDTYKKFINPSALSKINGMAIKLTHPFVCIDIDIKNTPDKEIYHKLITAVNSIDDSIIDKTCIEKTRNGGYHIFFKYPKLTSKSALARMPDGDEVIAAYSAPCLSYCTPTPGYESIHNSFEDMEELTDDDYDILATCAMSFDLYVGKGDANGGSKVIIEYPLEHETVCLQFDEKLPEDAFETILNDDLNLFENKAYKNKKTDLFTAFLRKGSKAALSAKVYMKSKKCLLFSSSIPGYPHWGDRKDNDDHSWVLTPSKLIYYKNDGDWTATMSEIKLISESVGIEIIEAEHNTPEPPAPAPLVTNPDMHPGTFPMDVLPETLQEFSRCHPFQQDYMGGAFIGALATLIGSSGLLMATDSYKVKAIVYLCIIGSPGSSKTPAINSVFAQIEEIDSIYFKEYRRQMAIYKDMMADYRNQKKGDGVKEPVKPQRKQMLIKDVTMEMLFKVLAGNPGGCCSFSDELSGYFKRIAGRYGDNDELQKMLELWSGPRSVSIQRIGREEDWIEDPVCSIFGGIQGGVVESMAAGENEHNGWYHRFVFVHPEMQEKRDWGQYSVPPEVNSKLVKLYNKIYEKRDHQSIYKLSPEADEAYGTWYNSKNVKYNEAADDAIKGIIAKYQDYCLRFALILQITHYPERESHLIGPEIMSKAIRLTEYFLYNMHKTLKLLNPETPIDKLSEKNRKFYKALPVQFTNPKAIEVAKEFNIKQGTVRTLLTRWSKGKEFILSTKGEQQSKVYFKEY